MNMKNRTEYIHWFLKVISESQDFVFSIQTYLLEYYFTFEKIIKLKNYLFVSTPSEEILAIRTPVTRPNNPTVHSSDFVGEGKETEDWIWKKHILITHKADKVVFFSTVRKLCLRVIYIM